MRTILEWKEVNVAPKGKKPVLVHHVNKATHTKWEDARKDFNQRLEGGSWGWIPDHRFSLG